MLGPQQQTNYQAQQQQAYGGASQQLNSQLAQAGALNSGRAATTATGLKTAELGNISNYNAQVPVINNQNSFNQGLSAFNAGAGFTSPIAGFGSTQTSSQNALQNFLNTYNQQGTSSQNQQQTTRQNTTGSGVGFQI